ncbi:MAG: DUF4003 family protein [Coriobacteriaceae bacterium]|nr:DUF4003 family protein [Coriobacteriaceae bacterium]
MRQSLLERCEAQIRNEAVLKKGHALEFESLVKLAALMYSNAGREVDPERVKECKRILKDEVGIFSNFRGHMQYLVQVKMSLADDPRAYLEGVLAVYEQLKEGLFLPGELVAMAAMTIYENCPQEARAEVVAKTREAYAAIKEQHRFLTGEEDMALIALMIMAGIDPAQAAEKAEELYGMLKGSFLPGSDTPQAAAMILALSDKPAEQKAEDFLGMYDACKRAGHATARDKAAAIYASFEDLDADRAELVAEIGEVDDWLKKQKGYGAFGTGASIRRLFAATLVLEDRQSSESAVVSGTTSAVAQAIVEELLMILITIIITSIVVSTVVSSSNH